MSDDVVILNSPLLCFLSKDTEFESRNLIKVGKSSYVEKQTDWKHNIFYQFPAFALNFVQQGNVLHSSQELSPAT